jgi:hypothetical protein
VIDEKEVTEYYHRGVVCHLVGLDLAVPLDVELLQPGEGEETLSQRQLSTRRFWRAGHGRWDIENDCFNTLGTHWGLDHCFKHDPTAIVNFTLTLFIVYVLLQCFWRRNLKLPRRPTLVALARELDRTLAGCRAPWHPELARGP